MPTGLPLLLRIAALEDVDGGALGHHVADAAHGRQRRRQAALHLGQLRPHPQTLAALGRLQRLPDALDLPLNGTRARFPVGPRLGVGQDDVVLLRLGQERLQPIVVGLREVVELVIVAAGAADGQAEKYRTDAIRHFREDFVAAEGHFRVAGVATDRAEPIETDRDFAVGLSGSDLVAGQLFADELVIGLVVVEATDDVIAIAPGAGPRTVVLEPFRLGEADDVEPVAAPAFAVVRTDQQLIDELFVSTRVRRGDERGDLLRRRRQAGQVERETADQRPSIGFRGRPQPFLP